MNPKAIFELVRDTFKEWSEDKAPRLGAALAYYTIFSIGPLLVIIIAIASIVAKDADAKGQILSTISSTASPEAAEIIGQTIENANTGGANIIATVIGIVTLLLGASGVFGQLKDALNTIWEVKPKEGLGFMYTIKERFFSFTMVLGTGFLLLVSLVISAALSVVGEFLNSLTPGLQIIGQVLSFTVSLLVIAVIFMLLFRFLPDVKITWKDVWIGGLVTAILFIVGQIGLSIYLGSGAVGKSFGAAGSLVVVLVWIYYSTQILFLGAEFTQVYTNRYGSRVRPEKTAEFVTEQDRAQEGIPSKDGGSEDGKQRGRTTSRPRPLKASPWFK